MFAIVKSSIKTGSRVLHNCRRNAVFVIDTQRLNDLDDVKSNLNGTFQKSLEAKWKAVTVELKEGVSVKIISNKKEQLQENQISMKVSRSENRHGLVRNIVYFLNKNSKVVNSKLVLQYYINKKVCGNVESVEYTVPSDENSKIETSFYVIKKSTISACKNQLLSSSSKRSLSVLYDKFCQGFRRRLSLWGSAKI